MYTKLLRYRGGNALLVQCTRDQTIYPSNGGHIGKEEEGVRSKGDSGKTVWPRIIHKGGVNHDAPCEQGKMIGHNTST